MKIKRTGPSHLSIAEAVREAADKSARARHAAGAALPETPSIGFATSFTRADGREKVVVGPFADNPDPNSQTFADFMRTPGMVAVQQIWGLVRESLPDYVQRPGDMVFVTLSGVSLAQKWSSSWGELDTEDRLGLTLDAARTGLGALALLNSGAGRPTDDIMEAHIAIASFQDILAGKDPVWLSLHKDLSNASLFYKASDGIAKITEAALSDDPKLGGIKLNLLRDLASGDPKLPNLLLPQTTAVRPFTPSPSVPKDVP